MINKNHFYIQNLKSVVFLGKSEIFPELIKINKKLKLDTLVITSTHQSKLIKNEIQYKIFDKLDINFKKFVNRKVNVKNSIFISLGARYIFKKTLIENLFLNNLVNFHGSRLPLDSGGAYLSWLIMRQDRINNELVHLVDEGIDTGPIIDNKLSLFPRECQISADFQSYKLKQFLNFYLNFLKKIKDGNHLKLKHQTNYLARYNPRLNTVKDGLIDWNLDSYDLFNFINAFDEPFKGASTFLNKGNLGKLYIRKVHLHGGDTPNHPFMSGIISRHDKDWIVVSTRSKHMLLIEEVLNEKGVNILSNLKVGDRFFTPYKELEKSKMKRTIYNSKGLVF